MVAGRLLYDVRNGCLGRPLQGHGRDRSRQEALAGALTFHAFDCVVCYYLLPTMSWLAWIRRRLIALSSALRDRMCRRMRLCARRPRAQAHVQASRSPGRRCSGLRFPVSFPRVVRSGSLAFLGPQLPGSRWEARRPDQQSCGGADDPDRQVGGFAALSDLAVLLPRSSPAMAVSSTLRRALASTGCPEHPDEVLATEFARLLRESSPTSSPRDSSGSRASRMELDVLRFSLSSTGSGYRRQLRSCTAEAHAWQCSIRLPAAQGQSDHASVAFGWNALLHDPLHGGSVRPAPCL